MQWNIHGAGKRSPETLISSHGDFPAALAAYEADAAAWSIVPAGEAAELKAFGPLDSIVPRYGLGSHGTGVFVQRCGDGVTCLGFDYAASRTETVWRWLAENGRADVPSKPQPGTPEAFAGYLAAMAAGRAFNAETGRKCPAELTAQLVGLEGKRVEIVDCYGDKRRFYVGRSGGWMPCHLEIERRNSSGGCAVMGAPFQSVAVVGVR